MTLYRPLVYHRASQADNWASVTKPVAYGYCPIQKKRTYEHYVKFNADKKRQNDSSIVLVGGLCGAYKTFMNISLTYSDYLFMFISEVRLHECVVMMDSIRCYDPGVPGAGMFTGMFQSP
jgi:hypothetical protein